MFSGLRFFGPMDGWIWQNIITTTFKVIIYGRIRPQFVPERGIRQGDPFSLYLFIISAEYLGRYIHFMANQKRKGIESNSMKIPLKFLTLRLQMTTLFSTGQLKWKARKIKEILDHCYMVSGQLVNYKKSRKLYDVQMQIERKSFSLQVLASNRIGLYLGCINNYQTKSTNEDFDNIKRRLG